MTGPLSPPSPPPVSAPAPAPGLQGRSGGIRFRALVRASGGPRYAFALAVDAVGTGLLRPFMLLYGIGALLATAALTGGSPALRALAACTGSTYLVSAALAWSVRVRADPRAMSARPGGRDPRMRAAAATRMRLLLAANVIYVFCLNVPEVALPLVLVTQLHASPAWAAGAFAANTGLVVAFQVPVTVWMSRFSRRTALVISGIVLSVSYLGFLAGIELGHGWAAPALFGVSLLCTIGEIIYAGSSTVLVAATAPPEMLGRALARFQLSTGFGLAVSPAVITALAAHGPSALWASLAAATLLSAAVVSRDRVGRPRR